MVASKVAFAALQQKWASSAKSVRELCNTQINQAIAGIYLSQPEVGMGVGAELDGACVGAGVS